MSENTTLGRDGHGALCADNGTGVLPAGTHGRDGHATGAVRLAVKFGVYLV
jgi:hypothetical protein